VLSGNRPLRKALVIHQGALGDLICCLPALASLREAFPKTHMTYMGYPHTLELIKNRFYADAITSVDRADLALLYQNRKSETYPDGLREFFGAFGLIVIIGFDRGPLIRNIRRLSRARVEVIPPFPTGKVVPLVDHLLALPRRLNLPIETKIPRLFLLEDDRERASEILGERGCGPDSLLIAVHPGSGSLAKRWPLERFRDLARRVSSTYGAHIIIIKGPAEQDIDDRSLEFPGATSPVILDGLSLPDLGGVLERCRLFIGNDSGVTHMAAAIGVPVIAIFGPSDPVQWAPRGREVVLFRKPVSCSPCDRQAMLRCHPRLCLTTIGVCEVWDAAQSVLNGKQLAQPRRLRRSEEESQETGDA
jgi:ADP-heptose:LPS heptosyltransferase